MTPARTQQVYYYFLVTMAITIWSTSEVVAKLAQVQLPPLNVATVRFLLGAVLLTPIVLRRMSARQIWTLFRHHSLRFTLLGFSGITLAFGLTHLSVNIIDAFVASSFLSLTPLFVLVLGALVGPQRRKPRWYETAGIVVGVVGVVLFCIGEGGIGLLPSRFLLGNAMALVAAISFGFYTWLGIQMSREHGGLVVSYLSISIGGLLLIPVTLVTEGFQLQTASTNEWLAILWLAGFVVVVAYTLYFQGLRRTNPAIGTSLYFLKPPLALLFAWILLSEVPSGFQLAATAVVSLSFVIMGIGYLWQKNGDLVEPLRKQKRSNRP